MLSAVGKRILVQPLEIQGQTIIITNQKPQRYKVIKIGDEVTKVSENDEVYLDKYAGCEIEHEKEKFIVIDEGNILAKVDINK